MPRTSKKPRKRSFPLFTKKTAAATAVVVARFRSLRGPVLRAPLPPSPLVAAGSKDGGDVGKKNGGCGGMKKGAISRLWMRLDRYGSREIAELERTTVMQWAGIPSRDLRVPGPLFSNSSNIIAREKAFIINLEFIKAIVSADGVLILDPQCQDVLTFIDKLSEKLSYNSKTKEIADGRSPPDSSDPTEGNHPELPFEFQVLEIALEVVCEYMDSKVADLVRIAFPALDALSVTVSPKILEQVRSLKRNLTCSFVRVQQARDELDHLLDDDIDMAQLYLTRKQIKFQQFDAVKGEVENSTSNVVDFDPLSHANASIYTDTIDADDVEELEMLLEAYFVQLDSIRNRLVSVREYINDTEDCVNIQLSSRRNELMEIQLLLSIVGFAMTTHTLLTGIFGMNLPYELWQFEGQFSIFVAAITFVCFVIIFLLIGFARKNLLLGC